MGKDPAGSVALWAPMVSGIRQRSLKGAPVDLRCIEPSTETGIGISARSLFYWRQTGWTNEYDVVEPTRPVVWDCEACKRVAAAAARAPDCTRWRCGCLPSVLRLMRRLRDNS